MGWGGEKGLVQLASGSVGLHLESMGLVWSCTWFSWGKIGWNVGVIAVCSTVLLAWGRGRGRGGSGKSWG